MLKRFHRAAVRNHAVGARTATVQLGISIVSRFLAVAVFALSCGSAFVVTKSLEHEKPVNVPTYESALPQSREICELPVVVPDSGLYATDVVVVRQNGDTTKMDTTEAWARAKSKEHSGDVWVVGICAEDIVDPATYRAPAPDAVRDVTFE